MKYKVGDEVLVKARIVEVNAVKAMPYTIVREKNVGYTSNSMLVKALDIVQKPDMTAEEAWEIAKKILFIPSLGGIGDVDLQEIFGTFNIMEIMKNNSPQEAKAKIEAWEAEKNVKVGDLVEFEGNTFCVTGLSGNYCCGLDKNGLAYSEYKKT